MDQDLNIVPTQIHFLLLILHEKQTALWIEDRQPHEYLLHLFGKEFLDAFIAETNSLDGHLLKVTLEVALGWKPISHEEHLAIFG